MPRRADATSLAAPRRRSGASLSPEALSWIAVVLDIVVIVLAAPAAALAARGLADEHGLGEEHSLGVGVAAALLFTTAMHARGHDRAGAPLDAGGMLPVWVFVGVSLSAVAALLGLGRWFFTQATFLFLVATPLLLLAWRAAVRGMMPRLVAARAVSVPTVALLADATRPDLPAMIEDLGRCGLAVSRVVRLPPGEPADATRVEEAVAALIRHVRVSHAAEVVVAVDWARLVALGPALERLAAIPVPVKLVAETDLARALAFGPCDVGSVKGVVLKPAALSLPQRVTKRAFDIVCASLGLIVAAPVLAAAAIAIRLDSPGPVFFRQWRGGYNGRRFRILKFRTMHTLDDGAVVRQASPGDPRVSRVGRILRRTSIDELPQLINVLRGEMSLVGPRPHALAHDHDYGRLIDSYAARHSMKPGITGWAQVNGCRGETPDVDTMRERIAFDLGYIRDWSLMLDVRILVRTALEVVRARDAW